MRALLQLSQADGHRRRCDARCYNGRPGAQCRCICGGANHGKGRAAAIQQTRALGQAWIDRERAQHASEVTAEFGDDVARPPLFALEE